MSIFFGSAALFDKTNSAKFKDRRNYDGRRLYCAVSGSPPLLTFALTDQQPNKLGKPSGTFTQGMVTVHLAGIGSTQLVTPLPINIHTDFDFNFTVEIDAALSEVSINVGQNSNLDALTSTLVDGTLSSIFIQDVANGPYRVVFIDNNDDLNPITVRDVAKHTKLTLIPADTGGSEAGPMSLQIPHD